MRPVTQLRRLICFFALNYYIRFTNNLIMEGQNLPVLAPVPNIALDPLIIKANNFGVTVLKENTFVRRYVGNRYSAVDINGNLWLKKTELDKLTKGERQKRFGVTPVKKKPRIEMQGFYNNLIIGNEVQIYENLLTHYKTLYTLSGGLSTKKTANYSINKREVRQRILGYINTHRGKKELYFWTVTFPPEVDDRTAYRLYNIWLTALRQRGMLREYIWIAERQENGTVHFHIAIPHKMPVQRANAMMRGTLKNAIKKGTLNYSLHKIARYNGVDIAKNRHTKRVTNFAVKKGTRALVTYLTKYVTKNNTEFLHLAWHNSRGYSSLFTGVTFSIPEFKSYGFPAMLNRAAKFETEFFTFVPWANGPPEIIMRHLYKINSYTQFANDPDNG